MRDYTPEENLDRLHGRFIEILDALDEVCGKSGIPWFLYAGTLLGAVREARFIPYDDDVDVSVPNECIPALLGAKWPEGMQIDEFPGSSFYKLGQRGSLMVNMRDRRHMRRVFDRSGIEGVHIDVFPMFSVTAKVGGVMRPCLKIGSGRHMFPRGLYMNGHRTRLENRMYPVPDSPEVVLRQMYGEDYMKPVDWPANHSTFIDLDYDQDEYASGKIKLPEAHKPDIYHIMFAKHEGQAINTTGKT